MKIKRVRLREIVRSIVEEAAQDGQIQKIYRRSYANTIKMISKGGNKNTPPFTKKSSKPGKSGPPPISEQNDILVEGFENALPEGTVKYSGDGGILKINPSILVISDLRSLQENLPSDAVRLQEKDLHVTLIHQSILKPFEEQLEEMQLPLAPPIILDDEIFERTSPGKKSWAIRLRNQDEMRDYVGQIMELLGSPNTDPEPERRFHVSLANLTGDPHDSVR